MNIVVFGRGFLAEEFLLASDRTAERVCLGPVCFSFFLSSPLPLCAPARERPTAGPSRVRSQSAGDAREPAAQVPDGLPARHAPPGLRVLYPLWSLKIVVEILAACRYSFRLVSKPSFKHNF